MGMIFNVKGILLQKQKLIDYLKLRIKCYIS